MKSHVGVIQGKCQKNNTKPKKDKQHTATRKKKTDIQLASTLHRKLKIERRESQMLQKGKQVPAPKVTPVMLLVLIIR